MNISIKDNLLEKLEGYLKETSFKDLNELIEYILENYLAENLGQIRNPAPKAPDEITQRLKDLGYL